MDLGQVQSFCPFLLLVKPSLQVHHWFLRTVIDKQCFGHVLGSYPSLEPHCQPLPGLVPMGRPEQCRSLKYTPPSPQRCRADPCSPQRKPLPCRIRDGKSELLCSSPTVPFPTVTTCVFLPCPWPTWKLLFLQLGKEMSLIPLLEI